MSFTSVIEEGNKTIEEILKKQKGMRPMEFSILHMIQRQLPIFWQKFFEEHLFGPNPKHDDYYQMHAFIIKRRYFSDKKRFIVMTKDYLFNCDAGFTDDHCQNVKFESLKWRVPLKAMTKVQLSTEK